MATSDNEGAIWKPGHRVSANRYSEGGWFSDPVAAGSTSDRRKCQPGPRLKSEPAFGTAAWSRSACERSSSKIGAFCGWCRCAARCRSLARNGRGRRSRYTLQNFVYPVQSTLLPPRERPLRARAAALERMPSEHPKQRRRVAASFPSTKQKVFPQWSSSSDKSSGSP
jgi:hypothetical protein